ncbi:MAG: imidazole glycerol phosphate synthase subunit HisH [gamma proteobacterium symbiont of Bathyaustriella thionipta]|nr:imidazole glycerol phosphate synthase subunit HisH [gamma proteobacterium symbiont of Bathyaustriella thionipta]
MAQSIVVIDYGMGNLRSVAKAIEHVAAAADEVLVTDDAERIAAADRVVFPGQGAARDCMAAIGEHHLNQAIRQAVASKPFLGICMGLQVLLQRSEENEGTDLLGLFAGQVVRFPHEHRAEDGLPLKVPHMGWNQVRQHEHALWSGIAQDSRFYFVHSYHVVPQDTSLISGETDYGHRFVSAMARDNLFAVQFHPEKSAANGLQLLTNFLHWKP